MIEHTAHLQRQADAAELESAFSSFNEASSVLAEVYRDLETKVTSLNSELSDARQQRLLHYQEKERIARRLQNLLDVLPAGVVVLDSNGVIIEFNPAASDLLGLPLNGESWRKIVEQRFSPRWDDGHDVTLVDGRCVNISTQSIDEESGQLVLIKEVTETRHLQKQLSHLRRLSAMGEMASALAHQIRTPLSSALLYASNLKNTGADEVRRERFTGKLISRLQHLESLVEDMLLFARGGSFDFTCYSLNELISDFKNTVHGAAASGAAKLQVAEVPGDIRVNVNHNAFISILQNLMDNAIQASEDTALIQINVEPVDEKQVDILFSDNGPGISAELRESIFEPFFTTRAQGTGLGLAVVESVIRSHGGSISLEDKVSNTTFRIRLPIAPE